jgi:phosphopantothenoylcysteine decarboxylase/phosphopantothenate--cysteine ligase
MWSHPAVQENIATLKKRGYKFVEPDSGFLACGTYAKGRLANPVQIVEEIVRCVS